MLHTKAAGRTPSIVVVDSPSLGTTPRNIDLVRGSVASSLSICRVSISVVVDDVAVLVDFQHGLEFGVGDDVHGGQQRVTEMQLYAQVTLSYQMEAGTIALIGGQIKTEEGVAVASIESSLDMQTKSCDVVSHVTALDPSEPSTRLTRSAPLIRYVTWT